MVKVPKEIKAATEEAVAYIEAKETTDAPKWYVDKYSSLPQYMQTAIKAMIVALVFLFVSFLYILHS
jgi:hypothetical protein